MKTIVYVDGFNLYYGCIKNTPYHWLDLDQMCRYLLPNDDIVEIKYFTALVTARSTDPEKPMRQQLYVRALQTIPHIEIIYGIFLSHEIKMPLAPPETGYARVIKTEEKGSDVNIATHLLVDGFRNKYELAVLVTNDSDLLEPMKFVTQELGKPVGLLNPHKYPSMALFPNAMFLKQIRKGVLAKSQFPDVLTDAKGSFTKPANW